MLTDLENKLWLPGGKELWEEIGSLDGHVYMLLYNQQEPTVQHMGLCLVLYNRLDGRRV